MEGPFIVAVVAIVFVAMPAMIMHYVTEWRKTKTPSPDDERLVDDLWRTAQRMERRIETLERILDKEAPKWREDDYTQAYRDTPHA
jgi:phage shock protein B